MRVLLDECLPKALARELVGHEVQTVPQAGWAGLKNGDLLMRAKGKFAVLITVDQLLETQNPVPSGLALITLVARTNRIESLRPLVPAILQALETLKAGDAVRIGA